MELLAPAGTIEAFCAAIDAGADAVYVGAPGINARALAHRFSWAEIAAMVDHAHGHGARLYCAANSLVRQDELRQARETLYMLSGIGIDALIVQDLGLAAMARREFPALRLHASTLTCAVNSTRVGYLAGLGFSRVVLPREMSISEIREIDAKTRVELEVFVHGAMCYSYSGLCLFSSYQGGKSGLRGRCVQPCRRKFSWKGGGGGYLFSMKDLSGINLISRLAAAGVRSLKIEGRMRSAVYVERVVRGYRLALDADPGDHDRLREAEGIIAASMGRGGGSGYFSGTTSAADLINWRHSGNIGIFVGRVRRGGEKADLTLNADIARGDRLRLHRELSGERTSFTLGGIISRGQEVGLAGKKSEVTLVLPVAAARGDSLYLVDQGKRRRERGDLAARNFQKAVSRLRRRMKKGSVEKTFHGRGGGKTVRELDLWLRLSRSDFLREPLPRQVRKVILPLPVGTKRRMRTGFGKGIEVVWALPPVIDEARNTRVLTAIRGLVDQGQRAFFISHPGQVDFFPGAEVNLYGDYTLNVLNAEFFYAMKDAGVKQMLASIETDAVNLRDLARRTGNDLGMVLYGRPPLFTSRAVEGHLKYGRTFFTPREEPFELRRFEGMTVALAAEPFSILEQRRDLVAMGVGFGLIDLRFHRSGRKLLGTLLAGGRRRQRHSSFNFNSTLI